MPMSPMSDLEKARRLFLDAGLAFPTIPEELAARLKEQDRWLFSTRPIEMSPCDLDYYVQAVEETEVKDYAVLSHSGHGANSYAIQYYLVQGSLRMFLYLGWGGAYMDAEAAALKIRDCFSMADQVVTAAGKVGRFQSGERLTVVGSDFYGSYWLRPGEIRGGEDASSKEPLHLKPLEALSAAFGWLASYSAPEA
jgi:hypothetical protein